MAGFKQAVGRSLTWAAKNVDGAIALVLAVVVGVLGVLPDSVIPDKGNWKSQLISGTTLVILALVATALLRDRVRQKPVEDAINATSGLLAELPGRLRRLDELESLVAGTRRALEDMSIVRVLGSQHEITQAHADARRGTDRWIFKGGTGTYIRAVTLPECVAAARREKRHLTMRLEIIDPSDEDVCEAYAHYRRSLSDRPDGTGELWTTERARKESFATVLATFWYRQRYGLLDVGVGLSATMTTFRWDLSSHAVIITVEDPNRALTALAGTFYYESCDTELRASFEQARKAPIDRYKAVPLSDEPTIEEVRRLFDRIDLPLPKSFTDREVVEITRKALRAKDPYAS
ncbi:hypothetical protein N5079_10040 [Planotetraspora sp. A-T 1434]|uniref:hypothetical protein n=1 Tax=Planotetraspora sp. A-T 1434 TaxID=2979219 RepID=UPI0021C24E48|nr:hypothetical protein [Planotetraspora sp. A-T 1434]MCT9930555.1 hypothetical protein [Planotetraspora sp. A-T 1434]